MGRASLCFRPLLSIVWEGYRSCFRFVKEPLRATVGVLAGDKKSEEPGNKDKTGAGATWIPPDAFIRRTAKYWVPMDKVVTLKCMAVRHLPYLIFGQSMEDLAKILLHSPPLIRQEAESPDSPATSPERSPPGAVGRRAGSWEDERRPSSGRGGARGGAETGKARGRAAREGDFGKAVPRIKESQLLTSVGGERWERCSVEFVGGRGVLWNADVSHAAGEVFRRWGRGVVWWERCFVEC